MQLVKKEPNMHGLQWFLEMALPYGIQELFNFFAERLVTTLVDGVLRGIETSGLMQKLGELDNIKRKSSQRDFPATYGLPRLSKGNRKIKKCVVQGCDRPSRARGFCAKHYQAHRKINVR